MGRPPIGAGARVIMSVTTPTGTQAAGPRGVHLGLRENWRQFSLLIVINDFVGGMVGMERTVVPLIGTEVFRIASTALVVSFIVMFGVVKAISNLISGHLADIYGRKHLLVAGWLVGLPVPFMIGWGPSWGWVVAANALLGVNQGFAWSMTVLMKVDLVGPKSRGLAVGLNEFAGYLAVGITAFLTGYIAQRYGLRRHPSTSASAMQFSDRSSRFSWCTTFAITCNWRRPVTASARRRSDSGGYFAGHRSAIEICLPLRKRASSTI